MDPEEDIMLDGVSPETDKYMQNQENSAHGCRKQIGGCQRLCVGVDEMAEESQ